MTDWTQWKVALPLGVCGEVSIRRMVKGPPSPLEEVRALYREMGRLVPEGEYTCLYRGEQVWMSDTPDEIRDQRGVLGAMSLPDVKSVLIGGLGLGISVKMALAQPHVERIDVVELDADVIQLVGEHYATDPRVHLHHADVLAIKWPVGTHWDVAWFDIWPSICTDNLDDMAKLNRSYARRTGWKQSWMEPTLRDMRRREALMPWGRYR
jgi:hypothetical protein